MSVSNLVVIGASAGGVSVLQRLIASLPADFPAALLIVMHVPPDRISHLPEILKRSGVMSVGHAQEGVPLEESKIYVAPPNRHLMVEDGHLHLSLGPRENGHRPAIDMLFRTAAANANGSRVIGVLLSGLLDDGTQGLAAIKRKGGLTLVQDPKEAEFSSMPLSAVEHVAIDYVLPTAQLAPKLIELVQQPHEASHVPVRPVEEEQDSLTVAVDKASLEDHGRWGQPTLFRCPECGGALWEFDDNGVLRYRCHLDHAYSVASLAEQQNEQARYAMWSAVRALEEKASLLRRMAMRYLEHGQEDLASRFQARAGEAEVQANLLQQIILDSETSNTVE